MSQEWLAWRARVRRRCSSACSRLASTLLQGFVCSKDKCHRKYYSRTVDADTKVCGIALSLLVFCIALLCLPGYIIQNTADVVASFSRPIWGQSDIPKYPTLLPETPSAGWSFQSGNLTCEQVGWRRSSSEMSLSTPKKRIFDTFLFSSELDLLEIRLFELDGLVDAWIIVESDVTHSNIQKPLWWRDYGSHQARFEKWHDKIQGVVVDSNSGASHTRFRRSGAWGLEALQRTRIMKGLRRLGLKDGDIIITGDVDEIPRKSLIRLLRDCEGYPEDMALHMPTSIGGFEFYSYEEPKRHTKVRTFRQDRQNAHWFSHHSTIGQTLLLNTGWHCSWCFPSLDGFRFKMIAGVHADRVEINQWSTWWTHSEGDGMEMFSVLGRQTHEAVAEDVHVLLPSDRLLKSRLCRGIPPLEREFAIPESYSLADVFRRYHDKSNIEARRRWYERGRSGVLPSLIESSPNQFHYLMQGGCDRPQHENSVAGGVMRSWIEEHIVPLSD